MHLALQVGVVEVAAGVAVVVVDTATAEVAGAEMVAAAVMVAVCTACKVLHKNTSTVISKNTIHWGKEKKKKKRRSQRKMGKFYLRGWLADDMGLINMSTLRDDHRSSCRENFHPWSRYTQTNSVRLKAGTAP